MKYTRRKQRGIKLFPFSCTRRKRREFNPRLIKRELPAILVMTRGLSTITLGINLNHNLRPIAATTVSVNAEPYRESSVLKKLFGSRDEFQGISRLHTVPMRSATAPDGRLGPTNVRSDPLLHPLFRDLDWIISDTTRPIDDALRKFLHVSTQFLTSLEPELVFFLGAVHLIEKLGERGLPACRAAIAPKEARLCTIQDCYNVHLALRTMSSPNFISVPPVSVIGNDVIFDDNGRIFIITGPNQGGKTTYLQAIGLAQILFQAGLYVIGNTFTKQQRRMERPGFLLGKIGLAALE